MNIRQLKCLLIRDQVSKGVSSSDYTRGYVDYDTGNLLFDFKFNVPCDTYFHNVDEYADYDEGTPERGQWEYREDNWEMCGSGKFVNYPDNFIIRYRFARPSYIQVLEWFEKEFNATIDISTSKISVKNLHIPHIDGDYYVESWDYVMKTKVSDPVLLAGMAVHTIISRFNLLADRSNNPRESIRIQNIR